LIVGSVGEKALLDVEIPILSLTLAGKSIAQCLVVPFNQAVGLWMIGCREVLLDLPLLEKVFYCFVLELQSIVSLDVSRATKTTINVSVDEVRNFSSSLLRKRGCFWPTCKTFNCNSNEAFASRGERKRADQIDFPSIKESFNWDRPCLLSVRGLGL